MKISKFVPKNRHIEVKLVEFSEFAVKTCLRSIWSAQIEIFDFCKKWRIRAQKPIFAILRPSANSWEISWWPNCDVFLLSGPRAVEWRKNHAMNFFVVRELTPSKSLFLGFKAYTRQFSPKNRKILFCSNRLKNPNWAQNSDLAP